MVDFGYRSGKGRLNMGLLTDISGYFKALGDTGLKWLAIFGLIMGYFVASAIVSNTTTVLLVTALFGLMVSFPYYLLMTLGGDRSLGKIIWFMVLSSVLEFLIASFIPALSMVAPIAGFVLAVGFIYPNRVTIMDSILLYVAILVISLILAVVMGVTIFFSPAAAVKAALLPV